MGEISEISTTTSEDEIHQVMFKDGERLTADNTLKFPRLSCRLKLEENGKLLLKDDKESFFSLIQRDLMVLIMPR